jgi:hypothetical protein
MEFPKRVWLEAVPAPAPVDDEVEHYRVHFQPCGYGELGDGRVTEIREYIDTGEAGWSEEAAANSLALLLLSAGKRGQSRDAVKRADAALRRHGWKLVPVEG